MADKVMTLEDLIEAGLDSGVARELEDLASERRILKMEEDDLAEQKTKINARLQSILESDEVLVQAGSKFKIEGLGSVALTTSTRTTYSAENLRKAMLEAGIPVAKVVQIMEAAGSVSTSTSVGFRAAA